MGPPSSAPLVGRCPRKTTHTARSSAITAMSILPIMNGRLRSYAHNRTSIFRSTSPAPNPCTELQECELVPAVFATLLASQPTINRSTATAAYLSHVRTLGRHNGCPESCLSSEFVILTINGSHRALTAIPNSHSALLLLLDCRPPHNSPHPTTLLCFA